MTIAIIAFCCYVTASLGQFILTFKPEQMAKKLPAWSVQVLAAIALACHGIALYGLAYTEDGFTINAWIVASLISLFFVAYLLINSLLKPLHILYLYLFPLAAWAVLLATIFGQDAGRFRLESGIMLHILMSALAYSLLILATGQAILVNWQTKNLKTHNLSRRILMLPPLQTMERLVYELLIVGFVVLTAAMLLGFQFINMDTATPSLVQKITFTLFAWITYAIVIAGHLIWGWRGQFIHRWVVGAFFILLLGYFGSQWLVTSLL